MLLSFQRPSRPLGKGIPPSARAREASGERTDAV